MFYFFSSVVVPFFASHVAIVPKPCGYCFALSSKQKQNAAIVLDRPSNPARNKLLGSKKRSHVTSKEMIREIP